MGKHGPEAQGLATPEQWLWDELFALLPTAKYRSLRKRYAAHRVTYTLEREIAGYDRYIAEWQPKADAGVIGAQFVLDKAIANRAKSVARLEARRKEDL